MWLIGFHVGVTNTRKKAASQGGIFKRYWRVLRPDNCLYGGDSFSLRNLR
jgi:hypothetical protein